ncbi:EAL domain-containing protein [Aestuariibacter sp. GS-14]|uniref:bifunctional diguanylate cyclase/phosphodiesterase n=1 Tax=Aestuariibacter sp. GS-14 TaxID=2590670 RepID=UPI00112E22E8|nr:EAL domain-containing protein [Aestuariibacter sp. GS-14]TPV54767.1 EAL domain-containing protein [Aestuariibacter sp. GS-14]
MRRLSISYKVLFVMLIMVSIVCTLVVGLLLKQSSSQEHEINQSLFARDVTRYHQLQSLLGDRLSVWVESLKHQGEGETLTEAQLQLQLQRSSDFLLLQWDVSSVWLINELGEVNFSEGMLLPDSLRPMVMQTLQQGRPQQGVYCGNFCEMVVSTPIMLAGGKTYAVVMTTSLQELLALLSEASQAELALVRQPDTEVGYQSSRLYLNSTLSDKQSLMMRGVLRDLPKQTTIKRLITRGIEVVSGNNAYYAMLLPLFNSNANGHYVMFVHDIDDRKRTFKIQKLIIFLGGLGLVLTFVVSMFVLLRRYSQKLEALSNMLPLLANKRFDEFKEQNKRSFFRNQWFSDELDVLGSAAEELAEKLETLDQQVTVNTAKLEKMAMFDSLTGLPNRNMMTFQINKLLASVNREKGGIALLFIDLDNFKKVNDSHGHHFGDEVVKVASERLSRALRESDLISRFGGDEFVILLNHVETNEQVESVAKKLTAEFVEPMCIAEHTFYITISIGIAFVRDSKSNALEMMRHADTAMYEAKLLRGSSYRFFDANMNKKVMRQVELESEAQIAMKEQQFFLALQPQISLKTLKLVGFEALLRWRHPQRGLVSPGEFLPLLEHTPMMAELDFWVMEQAIMLLSELRTRGYPGVKMAINLSAAQFANESLQPYLTELIAKYSVDASLIELELTETVLVADIERAVQVIQQIRSLGCQIAVDDFGTGYSSLTYLRSIPSDIIKIDRSFIAGMMEAGTDRNIVDSTISMVRKMGLEVIAEGIETAAQLNQLHSMQCQYGQGYFISKPIEQQVLWQVLQSQVINGRWVLLHNT